MKATELQKEVLDVCIEQLKLWIESDDIENDTKHLLDAQDALDTFYEDGRLSEGLCEDINFMVQGLKRIIREYVK